MKLKVKVTNEVSKDYAAAKDRFNLASKEYGAIKRSMRILKGLFENAYENDDGESVAGDDIGHVFSQHLRDARGTMRKFENISKTERSIRITSEGEWKFYNEFECPDTGRTLYGKESDYETVDEVKLRFKGAPVLVGVDYTTKVMPGSTIKEQTKAAREDALKEVRSFRTMRKKVPSITKEMTLPGMPFKATYEVFAGGGVGGENGAKSKYSIHMVKGEILRLKEVTKLRRVFEPKKPKTNEHHVGIEIEFLCKGDKYKLAESLTKHKVSEYVELKDDGSLRTDSVNGYDWTHELCVLAPEKLIHEVLRCVINALDETGSKVNATCGLHVHLDMRNRDKNKVFTNFVRSQNILYAMNPRSRLDGTASNGISGTAYSKRVATSDFNEALSASGKYYGINPKTYERIRTIEIRLHSGSTNFEKISNWIKILVNIAHERVTYVNDVTTPEEFCDRLELNDDMLKYIKQRIAKFKDKKGNHVTIDEVA